jgi:hypothetical protein
MSEPEFLGLSGEDARDPVKRLRAVVEQAVVLYQGQIDDIEQRAEPGEVLEEDQEWQFWSGHLIAAQAALGVVDDAEKLANDAVARAMGSPSEREGESG